MRPSLIVVVGKVLVKGTLHAAGLRGVWEVFEEMPELIKEVLVEWNRTVPNAEARRQDLERTAKAGDEAIDEALDDPALRAALDEVPAERRVATTEDLRAFLRQVPGTTKQMFRTEEDPTGQTIPAALVPRLAEELEPILSVRRPHFKAGDRPIAGVDWELEELLGIGGFGEVWKARYLHSEKEPRRALKFCIDEDAKERLRKVEYRNCEIVRSHGNHPGIVRLIDTNLSADPPCLHFEYIAGGDLASLVRKWKAMETYPTPLMIADIMLRIARPVAFAHRLPERLVHRDLKPSNILIARSEKSDRFENGQVRFKITDFGIGGIANEQARREQKRGQTTRSLRALSGSGSRFYASPEQLKAERKAPPTMSTPSACSGINSSSAT